MDLLSNSIVDVYLNQKIFSLVYGMYTSLRLIQHLFVFYSYLFIFFIKLNSTLICFDCFQSLIYRSLEYINMQYTCLTRDRDQEFSNKL